MKYLLLALSLLFLGCAPDGGDTVTNVDVNTGDPINGDCVNNDDCISDESSSSVTD